MDAVKGVGHELAGVGDAARNAADKVAAGGDIIAGALGKINSLIGTIAGLSFAGLGLRQIAEMADTFTNLQARLALVTGSIDSAAGMFDKMREVANRTQQPLAEIAQVYMGVGRAAGDLGARQSELVKFTEGVAASLRLSGTSGAAASGALLQLTQLLGGVNVQAQEFNSLVDGAPVLLRAVAKHLGQTGVSMGELRQMVIKGDLSVQEFFRAALEGSNELIATANKMPPTIGGAFTVLRNNTVAYIGELDKQYQLTAKVAGAVQFLAEHIRQFAAVVEIAAIAWFGLYKQLVLAPAVMGVLTAAKTALTAALTRFQLAAAISGSTLGTLRAELMAANAATLTLTTSISKIGVAMAVLGAAFTGWQIGTILRENFLEAQLAGIALVEGLLKGWEAIKYGAQIAWAYIGAAWRETIATMGSVAKGFLDGWADGLQSAGMTGAADKLREWGRAVQDATANTKPLQAELAALEKDYKAASKQIDDITGEMADEAIAAFNSGKAHEAAREATKSNKAAKVELDDAQKKLAQDTAAVIAKLREQIFVQQQEEAQGNKLTAAQKTALDITTKLRDKVIGRTEAERALIGRLLEEMLVNDEANEQRREEAKLQEELFKWRQKQGEEAQKHAVELEGQVAKQLEENDALRYTAAQLAALRAQRLDEAIEIARQAVARDELLLVCNAETDAHKRTLQALLELKQARADNVTLKAAKDAADQWKKTADEVENGLTSGLMRAFESGKGFFQAFRDTLVNSFKTLVLQPIVRFVMQPIAAMVGGAYSSLASAATDGTGAGAGGASLLEGATYYNAAKSLNGGFGQVGEGLAGAWNYGAAYSGSTYGTAFGSQQSAMLAAQDAGMGTAAGGTGSALGSYGSAALGAIAGHYTGRAISGGYSTGGSGNATVNAATAIGTAIGAYFGMPGVGGFVGGAVGGVVNRAFGRQSPNVTGDGVEGTLSGGNFAGQQYRDWFQKGGWFKSDRSWTDLTKVDGEVQTALGAGAAGVLAQAKTYANALGLPADALDKVSSSVRIAFGSNEADNLKAIADAFEQYGEQLSAQYAQAVQDAARSGETTTATLQRLGGSLLSVNGVFESLGLHLARVSVAGGQAASDLLELTGGLDKFLAKTQAYIGSYFNEGEQSGLAARAILEQLSGAGLDFSGAKGRQDLRTLLESLDVNNADQRQQIAALLNVASDYAKVADYMKTAGLTLGEVAALAPTSSVLDSGHKTIDPLPDRSIALQTEGNGLLEGINNRLDAMQSSLESGLAAVAAASSDTAHVLRRWDTGDGLAVVVAP